MLFLRSLLFNIVWYVNLIVQMLVQTPFYFFLSHKKALDVPRRWAFSTHFFHRWLAGTKMEILGEENIPDYGCVVASKHQSLWDFYSLYALLPDAAYILKSELMKIPFFGWYVGYLDMIPIRRGDKGKALRGMLKESAKALERGRQILIYPEGTRTAPGAQPNYRYGITRMYVELGCPVVPVALNSGLYWPRRKFVRHPGTIRAKFMEPIMPGLSAEEFASELERRVEEGCDELYWLAAQDEKQPPLSDAVKTRILAHSARINGKQGEV
ncbi:MAG: lysophospholipid acyltransferase family protein [Pseudomonadota bacterium]